MVFPKLDGSAYTPSAFGGVLKSIFQRVTGKAITANILRHSFVSRIYDQEKSGTVSNNDLQRIATFMAHSTATALEYRRRGDDDIASDPALAAADSLAKLLDIRYAIEDGIEADTDALETEPFESAASGSLDVFEYLIDAAAKPAAAAAQTPPVVKRASIDTTRVQAATPNPFSALMSAIDSPPPSRSPSPARTIVRPTGPPARQGVPPKAKKGKKKKRSTTTASGGPARGTTTTRSGRVATYLKK
jgi:hypothetical protein